MNLENRTDSDRLDDLLDAIEKQTAAINRLAMSMQEMAEPKPSGGFLWWLAALAALPALALAFIIALGAMARERFDDGFIVALVASVVVSVCCYILARCGSAISRK